MHVIQIPIKRYTTSSKMIPQSKDQQQQNDYIIPFINCSLGSQSTVSCEVNIMWPAAVAQESMYISMKPEVTGSDVFSCSLSANRVHGTEGGVCKKRWGAGKTIGDSWCYFEKQTRRQMLHHVKHVAPLVAMRVGRCERRPEGLVNWWAGFHNRESERVMKLNQEKQQQVYLCVPVWVWLCVCVCVCLWFLVSQKEQASCDGQSRGRETITYNLLNCCNLMHLMHHLYV